MSMVSHQCQILVYLSKGFFAKKPAIAAIALVPLAHVCDVTQIGLILFESHHPRWQRHYFYLSYLDSYVCGFAV
jgi:hypothetical protein